MIYIYICKFIFVYYTFCFYSSNVLVLVYVSVVGNIFEAVWKNVLFGHGLDRLNLYSYVIMSSKTSEPRITGLCEGNLPVTGEFFAQRASNAENVSIWWHRHGNRTICLYINYSTFFTAIRTESICIYAGLFFYFILSLISYTMLVLKHDYVKKYIIH